MDTLVIYHFMYYFGESICIYALIRYFVRVLLIMLFKQRHLKTSKILQMTFPYF